MAALRIFAWLGVCFGVRVMARLGCCRVCTSVKRDSV